MHFGILGALEARDGDRQIEFARPKQRAVLAVLLIEANRIVPLDRLIDLLWGGRPPAWATGALQVHISGLRSALEPDQPVRTRNRILVTQPPGYVLRIGPGDLDATRFEALAARGHHLLAAGAPTAARLALIEALALWRGPALAEFAFESFAQPEAARLEELRLATLEDRIEADLALGAHATLTAELEGLVGASPLRERLWAQLMLALYRSHRQSEALRACARARAALAELGLEPGPGLRRLEEDILHQSTSLDWRPPENERPATTAGAGVERTITPAPTTPLVGRVDEMRALQRSLTDAGSGRGSLALVSGEPGIGKTRLVEELAARCAAMGMAVSWGRCHEDEGAPSFSPWVQVIRGLLAGTDSDTLRRALTPGAREIAQIVPEVKELAPDFQPPPMIDAAAARFRLYEAINDMLGRLAARRPLAIVLEDLHWADVPSLQLVEFVASRTRDTGVLLVATFRDVDPAVGGPLAETLGVLALHPFLYRAALQGLSEGECSAFIAQAFGVAPSAAMVQTVHAKTDGNPFFVAELARLLASEGALTGGPDTSARVPVGVRDVIRRRLGRLPQRTNELLAMAAVLGREVDLPLLAVAGRLLEDDASELLEPSVAVGILVDEEVGDETGMGRYRFSHALVQETVLGELGLAPKAKLHARAASALTSLYGADDDRAVERAHHLYSATPVVHADEAFAAALHAAEVSESRLAFEQAEEQLRRAVELAGRLPTATDSVPRELEAQHRLATLLSNTKGYHSTVVAEAWRRARELCAEMGDTPEVLASLWGLARVTRTRAEFGACVQLGEHLLELARTSADPSFAIAGHECCGLPALFTGDPVTAALHLSQAVTLSDEALLAADAGSLVLYPAITCRAYLACARWILGEDEEADRLSATARRMADESGHPLSRALAVLYAAKLASMRGRAADAEALAQECLRLAATAPLGPLEAVAELLEGWARCAEGDTESGGATLARAISELRRSGWRLAFSYFHALEADAHRAAGRLDKAMASVELGLAVAEATGERYYEAELCRLAGEIVWARGPQRAEAARAWFRRAIEIAARQGALAWKRRAEASLGRP